VKYDKDPETAFEILKECLHQGIDVNHVDSLKAAPLHVALRKRQNQAISDCARINREHHRPVFDFNLTDKKELTPLHYAVEKQDHQLCVELLKCPKLDLFSVDSDF
jgi:ankyrin repeat protein